MSKFTIGTDPEFFIGDGYNVVPSCGLFNASKYDPDITVINGEEYAFSEDNVCVEVAIPPADSFQGFLDRIHWGCDLVRKKVAERGLEVIEGNAFRFSEEDLATEQAMMFGCDPDMNFYSLEVNDPPSLQTMIELDIVNMRCAGGHIHIGMEDIDSKIGFLRVLEWYFHDSILNADDDPPLPRRKLYGMAGSARMTKYGVEYRTPGNFWVFDDIHIARVYDMVDFVLAKYNDKTNLIDLMEKVRQDSKKTRDKINGILPNPSKSKVIDVEIIEEAA